MKKALAVVLQTVLLLAISIPLPAAGKDGSRLIQEQELRAMLTAFSDDSFEGRSTFTEGLGLAAAYIAEQLKSWGVKPGGDKGSYFQSVRVLGIKSKNNSTVTVESGGRSRTFKVGEGISLPSNVGAKRTFSSDEILFAGYGLDVPAAKYNDYAGQNAKGKVVVYLGTTGPKSIDQSYGRLFRGRARSATEQRGAVAVIGPLVRFPGMPGGEGRGGPQQPAQPQAGMGGRGGPAIEQPSFTTVQRLDLPQPPTLSGEDAFFEYLFSGQSSKYADLKAKATAQEPLPVFQLKGVRITFNLDAEYQVVRTQLTRNVVGIVEGKDSRLNKTYVAFGAHYDHVGYSEGEVVKTDAGPRRAEPRGRVTQGAIEDRFWNGADDDGSGSIALLAMAKAFARGPKPRRSAVFVWHTGEERGLYGSRYFADYPTVPIENIVAQINIDMIGRNRDNKTDEANSVYLIGSDRISTELHNISVDANAGLKKNLKLDFEYNDPMDPESLYTRSDHYSYAVKGIPVVFLTTGLHPDYHANTDSVEKINYEKMTRITQLAYSIGYRVANLEHAPVRDNLGARAGKGTPGKLSAAP